MTDAVTSTTSSPAATTTTASSSSSDTAITDAALADYDDFLTLLTAQLTNQDPLNPQDSTQFVEQIATFTAVEQQINTVERLDQLIAATNQQSVSDLASWVGMEVSAQGMAYSFDGEKLELDALSNDNATAGKMIIKDTNENKIAEIAYNPKTDEKVSWDGTKSDGSKAEEGAYFVDFELTITQDDGTTKTENYTSAGFAKVTEARLIDGAQALILSNGLIIEADKVNAVRDPATGSTSSVTATANDVIEAVENAVS